jgi:hypothetical protein
MNWRVALMMMVLAAVVLGIYSNTLNSPFHFDDLHNISNNLHLRITRLSPADLKAAGFDSPSFG